MHVMIHNPSSIPVNHTVIKVPDGQFRVEIFDSKQMKYVKVDDAKVICSEDRVYDIVNDVGYQKLDFMNC